MNTQPKIKTGDVVEDIYGKQAEVLFVQSGVATLDYEAFDNSSDCVDWELADLTLIESV